MTTLRLCHLYPGEMNIYADRGNIAVFRKRLEWRGLSIVVTEAGIGDPVDPDVHDLYYLGGGQDREPLGNLVQWIPETGNPKNHVIRFTFDKAVGDGFGVMYHSKPFPIEEAARYRFQCRFRTNGPAVKVFIKCYDQMPSDYKPNDLTKTPPHPTSPAGGTGKQGSAR